MRARNFLILAFAIFATPMFAHADQPTKTSGKKTIRWILAHEPIDIFRRAAQEFSADLAKTSKGQLQVEILTLKQYGDKYNNGVTPTPHQVLDLMQQGRVEMSQMYTTTLGAMNRDLYVLDLPYLFRDYKQAEKVLEGGIGKSLLGGFERTSNLHGLAFTYSGGYRVIPGEKAIAKVSDFKDLKIRTSESPVAQDTLLAVGARPVVMDLESIGPAVKSGRIEEAESTFVRIYGMHQNEYSPYVNDTAHSLFLTSIIIDSKFFKSLSPKMQAYVTEAARHAARVERATAIREAAVAKTKCEKDGLKVVTLPESEREKFKALTKPLYEKYKDYFTANYISQIENVH